ncbi:hypothetical protein [Nocardia sp. NPDC051570]|uniref:hypothetical protein n=1 Tax=Nocardia sp. NPDC051570 TaxID=3364324 RepID=UPI0037954D68
MTTEGCVFVVDYISPTSEQIDEFETAEAQFAWLDTRHNGILCYRIGETAWESIPFNPHTDTPPETSPGVPTIEPGQHLTLPVGLADIDRSPVLAVRTIRWPEYFISAIHATVHRLAAQPLDADRRINEANYLHRFVGSERMARQAGVRCRDTN